MIQILREYDRDNFTNYGKLWANENQLESALYSELQNNIVLLRKLLLEAGYDSSQLPNERSYVVRRQVNTSKLTGMNANMDLCISDRDKFFAVIELKTFTNTHETKNANMNQLGVYSKYCEELQKQKPDINIFKILMYPEISKAAPSCKAAAARYDFKTLTLEEFAQGVDNSNVSKIFKEYINGLRQNMFNRETDEEMENNVFKKECFLEELNDLAAKNNIKWELCGRNNNGYKLYYADDNSKRLCFYVIPFVGSRTYKENHSLNSADPIEVADKISCFCVIKDEIEEDIQWDIQKAGLNEYWISYSEMGAEGQTIEKIKRKIEYKIINCLDKLFDIISINEFKLKELYCNQGDYVKNILNSEDEVINNNINKIMRNKLFNAFIDNQQLNQYFSDKALQQNHYYIGFNKKFYKDFNLNIGMGLKIFPLNSKYNGTNNGIFSMYFRTKSNELYEFILGNQDINEIENELNVTCKGIITGEGKEVHFIVNDFNYEKINNESYINKLANDIIMLAKYIANITSSFDFDNFIDRRL